MRQMLTRIALPGPTFSMPPMRSALGARDMLRMQSTNLALEGIGTLSPRWLRFCGITFTGNKAHRNRFQRSRRTAAFRDNAHHMANVLPPSWQAEAVLVPIPARTSAVRERGFDHISLIGAELSRITGMPLTPLLRAKPRRDQRDLDARQRLANMAGSFDLEPNGPSPYGNALKERLGIMPHIVLIDDVFTTGATLFTAGNTLRAAGAKEIYAVTFIRA